MSLRLTDLVVFKQLEKEGGNSGSDANEEVDDDEEDVSCAGNLEPEGGWVHDGSDGPPGRHQKQVKAVQSSETRRIKADECEVRWASV